MKKTYNMGIDVGSTTVKTVILYDDIPIYKEYRRHFSDVKKAVKEILRNIYDKLGDICVSVVYKSWGDSYEEDIQYGNRCRINNS